MFVTNVTPPAAASGMAAETRKCAGEICGEMQTQPLRTRARREMIDLCFSFRGVPREGGAWVGASVCPPVSAPSLGRALDACCGARKEGRGVACPTARRRGLSN